MHVLCCVHALFLIAEMMWDVIQRHNVDVPLLGDAAGPSAVGGSNGVAGLGAFGKAKYSTVTFSAQGKYTADAVRAWSPSGRSNKSNATVATEIGSRLWHGTRRCHCCGHVCVVSK
jgi:hypothetical protein